MKPKIVATEKVYEGKVFDVSVAKIKEGESEYKREIVEHNGSAVIVAVDEEKNIWLVRQYRHAAQDYLLELPAGTTEDGESPEDCAKREIEEEIGVKAGKIEKLTEFFVSPGFLTEKMYVYLATDLIDSKQNLDEDEAIEIEKINFAAAFEKIRSGEIQDAKTIIGLILAGARFGFSVDN